MYRPITEAKGIYTDNKYVISLTKKDREEWPLIISSVHSENGLVDPNSAMVLFYILLQQATATNNIEIQRTALSFLQSSANVNFLPALRVLGSRYLEIDGMQQRGFILLKQGADLYNDPECCFQIGLILVAGKKEADNGIGYLKRAATQGFKPAYFTLGQIFSPVGPFDYPNKDTKTALEFFSQITEEDKIPAAFREMANIYESGLGIEKDLEKAKMYREKAEKITKLNQIEDEKIEQRKQEMMQENQGDVDEQKIIEEMQKQTSSLSKTQKIVVFGLTATIAGAFLYLVYKKTNK